MSTNDILDSYEGSQGIPLSTLLTNFAKRKEEKNVERENIKPVDIKGFKDNQHALDYTDSDFTMVNSSEGIPDNNNIVRPECFTTAVRTGRCIQLDINYRTYQLKAGDLLFGLPNTVISHTMLSPKYKIRLTGFSTCFPQRIIKMEKETWSTAVHIHNNPVKSISDEGDDSVFGFYQDLAMVKINNEPHRYYREMMQHLFPALFCEMLGQFHKETECSDESDHSRESTKQVNYTLWRFTELLSRDKGIHHSVSYFTNGLCCTPKHFSEVIKQACGRTSSDLVNETAIEQVKYRLKRSDKSIEGITEEFDFPNQSFSGKHARACSGTSLASYRSRKEDVRRDAYSIHSVPHNSSPSLLNQKKRL